MPRTKALLAAAALAALAATGARAQAPPRNNSGYPVLVVQSCGQANYGALVGQYAPPTQDVTGTTCNQTGSNNSTTVQTAVPLASGTGGTSPLTLGTTPTSNAVSAPATGTTRRSLFIQNQSTTASVTFCFASSNITPANNVAGCYTLNPNGGFLAYPASGYVPQDAFNAVASAPGTPVTVEVH